MEMQVQTDQNAEEAGFTYLAGIALALTLKWRME